MVHRDSYMLGREAAVQQYATATDERLANIETTNQRLMQQYQHDREEFAKIVAKLSDTQQQDRATQIRSLETLMREHAGRDSTRSEETCALAALMAELKESHSKLEEDNAVLWRSHKEANEQNMEMHRERSCARLQEKCIVS